MIFSSFVFLVLIWMLVKRTRRHERNRKKFGSIRTNSKEIRWRFKRCHNSSNRRGRNEHEKDRKEKHIAHHRDCVDSRLVKMKTVKNIIFAVVEISSAILFSPFCSWFTVFTRPEIALQFSLFLFILFEGEKQFPVEQLQ